MILAHSTAIPGQVYLVPTPIGNLEDISIRALGILRTVDLIAAEDTRHTGHLLEHFQIKNKLLSFHQHNYKQRIPHLLEFIKQNQSIAVVSDAGMPLISDPGQELVTSCIQASIPVIPLPGPNAALTALIASGLATNRFMFEGFLCAKQKERQIQLARISHSECTVILYESPHRLLKTLSELVVFLGPERNLVIARELTKLYEEFWRGTIGSAISYFESTSPRGEFTILISGKNPERGNILISEIEEALSLYLKAGLSPSQASKKIALERNIAKNYIYSVAMELIGQSRITPVDAPKNFPNEITQSP